MVIRRARVDEAERVSAILGASYGTLVFLPLLHSDEDRLRFVRDVLLVRDEVWVAELDGRVAGFAALASDMLGHLYVHPEAHGRGAGTALFEHAQRRRPDGFTFWVFQKNAPARRFYESLGARLVRLTDGRGNEEQTPDALYEWKPGAG